MKTNLAVVLLLCAHISMSSACSCFPHEGLETLCWYDLIFRGQATSEDRGYQYGIHTHWVYTMQVDFAVKMPDSLQANRTITMSTPVGDSMCGLRLSLHTDVLYFAHAYEGEISSNMCAPNRVWDDIKPQDQRFIIDNLNSLCNTLIPGSTNQNPEQN